MRFSNRETAGHELVSSLREFAGTGSVVVALPRGGVALGYEIAKTLHLPLDVMLVRKLSHPASPEYAVGALAEGGQPVYNETEINMLDDEWREDAEKEARQLITHRRQLYFGDRHTRPDLFQKTVIVVDDGIATGYTMKAAVMAVAEQRPDQIIIAVPIASQEGIRLLEGTYDRLVVLDDPRHFQGSISLYYADFPQLDDEDVKELLERSRQHAIHTTSTTHP